ncbi:hypothetical protein CC78DRAFT_576928 [Lojkania enalia]|uniref:PHD-type domain-containing protein n=1 Tax=Lojkania enalia TaxID=147567 RepID=A0A9P4KH17_9PLEO|nr:hypothetical protein CC78DRAFT_576928 [Didymosphaeria enalia]
MSGVGGLDDTPVIANYVQACFTAFHETCTNLSKADVAIKRKILPYSLDDELGRFRLWCGNIGSHRKGRSSLDFKLREASHIKERVIELLKDLDMIVREANEIIIGERIPWEDFSDSESDISGDDVPYPSEGEAGATELQQLASNVAETITCLMRLSIAIRNPAPHDQFKESTQIDTSHFETFDIDHVRQKFPKAPDYLIERLGRAISRRRQYLRYREEHRKKLEKGLELSEIAPIPAVQVNLAAPVIVAHSEKIESTVASSIPIFLKSGITPPDLDEHNYYEDTVSQTSYASSTSDPTKLRPPPLPEQGQDGNPFECPLCFRFTSLSQLSAWHKHIYRDLHPYVCSFEDCKTPDSTFESRNDWFNHENTHRQWWECVAGCNAPFRTRFDFKEHLNLAHPDLCSESRLDDLMRTCERKAAVDTGAECVLCQQQLASLTQLRRHLGKHHEELALFALPSYLKDSEDEKDGGETRDDSLSIPSPASLAEATKTETVFCSHCGLEVGHNDLIVHIETEHPDSVLTCEIRGCDLRFLSQKDLTEHQQRYITAALGSGIKWRLYSKTGSFWDFIDEEEVHSNKIWNSNIVFVYGERFSSLINRTEILASSVPAGAIDALKNDDEYEIVQPFARENPGTETQHWLLIKRHLNWSDIKRLTTMSKTDPTGVLEGEGSILDVWKALQIRHEEKNIIPTYLQEPYEEGIASPQAAPSIPLFPESATTEKTPSRGHSERSPLKDTKHALETQKQLQKSPRVVTIQQNSHSLLERLERRHLRRYCICDDVSYGQMISCDNNCEKEWFHFECVGMTEKDIPTGPAKWYCPDCCQQLGVDTYGNLLIPPQNLYSIVVRNLGLEIDDSMLLSIFQNRFPSCISARVVPDDTAGAPSHGYVDFTDMRDQQRAVKEIDGEYCGSWRMSIDFTDINKNPNDHKPNTWRTRTYQVILHREGRAQATLEISTSEIFIRRIPFTRVHVKNILSIETMDEDSRKLGVTIKHRYGTLMFDASNETEAVQIFRDIQGRMLANGVSPTDDNNFQASLLRKKSLSSPSSAFAAVEASDSSYQDAVSPTSDVILDATLYDRTDPRSFASSSMQLGLSSNKILSGIEDEASREGMVGIRAARIKARVAELTSDTQDTLLASPLESEESIHPSRGVLSVSSFIDKIERGITTHWKIPYKGNAFEDTLDGSMLLLHELYAVDLSTSRHSRRIGSERDAVDLYATAMRRDEPSGRWRVVRPRVHVVLHTEDPAVAAQVLDRIMVVGGNALNQSK